MTSSERNHPLFMFLGCSSGFVTSLMVLSMRFDILPRILVSFRRLWWSMLMFSATANLSKAEHGSGAL